MKISPPELQIRSEISEYGCISFARFMDLALYHPDGGFYTQAYRKPYTEDFYTSPVTHPSFGALITLQIFHFWEILGSPINFIILEIGSGRGELADVIEHTSRQLPNDFYKPISFASGRKNEKDLFYFSIDGQMKVKTYTDWALLDSEIVFFKE